MNRARLKAELRARKISLHRHMLRVLGFEPALRERVCVREARECIATLRPLLDAMRATFEELDLEDLRKAPWI